MDHGRRAVAQTRCRRGVEFGAIADTARGLTNDKRWCSCSFGVRVLVHEDSGLDRYCRQLECVSGLRPAARPPAAHAHAHAHGNEHENAVDLDVDFASGGGMLRRLHGNR